MNACTFALRRLDSSGGIESVTVASKGGNLLVGGEVTVCELAVKTVRCRYVAVQNGLHPITDIVALDLATQSQCSLTVDCGSTPPFIEWRRLLAGDDGSAHRFAITHEQQDRILAVIARHCRNVGVTMGYRKLHEGAA